MATKYYCDRCGIEIKNKSMFDTHGFDDFFTNVKLPFLCDGCKEEFSKVLDDFMKEGKKKKKLLF